MRVGGRALADGHRIVYDREVPFELRAHEQLSGGQSMGTLEAVKVKVMLLVRRAVCKALRVSVAVRDPPRVLMRVGRVVRACVRRARVQGDETNPQHVRIELSTESDLFFLYNCALDLSVRLVAIWNPRRVR